MRPWMVIVAGLFAAAWAPGLGPVLAAQQTAAQPKQVEAPAPSSIDADPDEPTPALSTGGVTVPPTPLESAPVGPPSAPELVLPDLRPRPGGLLREGMYLIARRGWARPIDSSHWVYIFDADADGNSEPPMILHPCQRLTEIVRIVESRPETTTLKITGQVFVYEGRNYLLPQSFSTVARDDDDAARRKVAEEAAKPIIDSIFGDSSATDPTVEQLVRTVESAADTTRPRPAAPTAPPANARLRPEGTALVAQAGRVVRGGTTGWVFTIENDTDEPEGAPATTPLELLPCLTLSEMRNLVERFGDRLRFVVSGPVFVYGNRNYLMPTMYVIDVDRDGNITSAQ